MKKKIVTIKAHMSKYYLLFSFSNPLYSLLIQTSSRPIQNIHTSDKKLIFSLSGFLKPSKSTLDRKFS